MPIEFVRNIDDRRRDQNSATGRNRKKKRRRSPFAFLREQAAMNWVALQMLMGDRAKYLALIFTIAFSSFLIAQQLSIFCRIMDRTRSQLLDIRDADIWVMDPATQYLDEVYSLKDSDVDRVRRVPGVKWAVRFFKGSLAPKPRTADSELRFFWESTTPRSRARPISAK